MNVYAGLYGARSRFEAALSDQSAAPFINNALSRPFNNAYGLYTVDMASRTVIYDSRFTMVQTLGMDFYGDLGADFFNPITPRIASSNTNGGTATVTGVISPADGVPYEKIARLHSARVLATTVVQTCVRYEESQRCRFCAKSASTVSRLTIV